MSRIGVFRKKYVRRFVPKQPTKQAAIVSNDLSRCNARVTEILLSISIIGKSHLTDIQFKFETFRPILKSRIYNLELRSSYTILAKIDSFSH